MVARRDVSAPRPRDVQRRFVRVEHRRQPRAAEPERGGLDLERSTRQQWRRRRCYFADRPSPDSNERADPRERGHELRAEDTGGRQQHHDHRDADDDHDHRRRGTDRVAGRNRGGAVFVLCQRHEHRHVSPGGGHGRNRRRRSRHPASDRRGERSRLR